MRLSSPLIIGSLALSLAGCGPLAVGGGQTAVVASIYPLAFVAERVAGPDASVTLVTPAGAEPHEFEPTPGQIAAMSRADLLLWNGAGVDAWAERVQFDRLAAGTLSAGLIETVGEPLHEGTTVDPHAWLDPTRLKAYANAVAVALGKLDPDHATAYSGRAAALMDELSGLDAEFRAGLQDCESRDIIVAHDAFQYLGARYHLEVHALAGLSPEEEPSPATVAQLHALAAEKNLADIFAESLTDSGTVRALAADLGGQARVLDPIEGLTPKNEAAGKDYLSLMRDNLAALRQSLQCR
jgi:zinc transport system substrate-binding protein